MDVTSIRQAFPELTQTIHGKPLVYLDNSATTLKHQRVLTALNQHYSLEAANIHRGVHSLSEQATLKYEDTRQTVADFIGAARTSEIIFTSGTTDSINLLAHSFGEAFIQAGDEIVITQMEHHSNIVPWQLLCQRKQCQLKIIPLTPSGELDMSAAGQILSPRTKLLSFVVASNSLGTINPVEELIALAKKVGAKVLCDGAQWVAHHPTDVQKWDCDFFAFSAHKLFGPTGVGVLYGKQELLEALPPFKGGGDMIANVSLEASTYAEVPHKFEAGTPHIAGVIGLGEAIRSLQEIGWDTIEKQEYELTQLAQEKLQEIPGLKIYGTAKNKVAVVSFTIEGVHPHDIGTMADQEGIALRTGHHCTQPVMQYFGIPATARASFAFYNTQEEVLSLVNGLKKIREFFQ